MIACEKPRVVLLVVLLWMGLVQAVKQTVATDYDQWFSHDCAAHEPEKLLVGMPVVVVGLVGACPSCQTDSND